MQCSIEIAMQRNEVAMGHVIFEKRNKVQRDARSEKDYSILERDYISP